MTQTGQSSEQSRQPPRTGPFPEDLLTPLSAWYHPKSRGLYLVIGVSMNSTNGAITEGQRCVVYWSTLFGQMRHREISEFLDGRFIPLPNEILKTIIASTGGLCPVVIQGERCALQLGHEGGHKWERGD